MDKQLVEKEEDETTSKRNRIAKSAREATKYIKKDKPEKDGIEEVK